MPSDATGTTPPPPRDPIEFLMADRDMRPTTQNIAWWLWHKGGHQVHERVINTLDMEKVTGRDRRTVERALKDLQHCGILEIVEWNKRSGAIHFQMLFPARQRGERHPDPQQYLPFITSDFSDSTPSGSSPDSTPSGSSPDSTPSGSSPDSTPPATSRDERPDKSAHAVRKRLDKFAQNCPADGQICANLPANLRKSASRARPKYQRKEDLSISPKVQSNTKRFGAPRLDKFAQICPGPAAAANDPPTIGTGVVEAVQRCTRMNREDRAAYKERLKLRICDAAAQPPDWWVAGAAADLVLLYGYDLRAFRELLGQLDRRKRLPAEHPHAIYNPGAWLQHRLAQVADELGMPWGRAAMARAGRSPLTTHH